MRRHDSRRGDRRRRDRRALGGVAAAPPRRAAAGSRRPARRADALRLCGDYWLNYGAHLFPAPGSLVDRMARECGLETVPVTGGMMGLAVGSTILDGGRVETYPFRLPLSMRERIAFAKAGLKVQLAVRRYHAAENRYEFENDRTFGDFLGPLPPAVARDLLLCRPSRDGGARRARGGRRDRAVRARLGRQGLADRPQPARWNRAAAGGARPRARRARPHRQPRGRRAPDGAELVVLRRRGDPRART